MNIQGESNDNTHIGDVIITQNLEVKGDISAQDLLFDEAKLSGDLDCNGNDILNCGNLQATTFNGGTVLTNPLSSNLDCANNFIQNCVQIQSGTSLTLASTGTTLFFAPSVNLNSRLVTDATNTRINQELSMLNNNIRQVNEVDTDIINSNAAANVTFNTDLSMGNNSLTNVLNATVINDLNVSNINGNQITTSATSDNRMFQKSIIMGDTLPTQKTIHIFEAAALNTAISISGTLFHPLDNDTEYIFHGSITLQAGLLFGSNCSVKGSTISSTIIFDESAADIVGFRSIDNNLYIQDLTISGGGGHFTSTDVGLLNCTNYNIGAGSPFYGRNKRFRIVNCNILAPYSIGYVYGFGTLNFNNCFINGGGGAPTGVYTRVGLTVADGLSLEFNNNKVVLFAGAQVGSALQMLKFINVDPLLQFNAVNVSGNIFHPRSSERAISFFPDSKTELGLISSNTLIRTGGVGNLIDYPRASYKNYNAKEIVNYEIIGNSGVINGEAILQSSTGVNLPLSAATYIDLNIPITSINAMTRSKRFTIRFTLLGVSGAGYSVGNLLVSVTNPNSRAYIEEVGPLAGGVQFVYITDMSGIFPDLLNYKEQDLSLVDTGITSTTMQIGDNTGNLEFKMIDKDPVDMQFSIMINFQNNGADDEVQFILLKDEGSGFVSLPQSEISHTISRANRLDTAVMSFIERVNSGDMLKLQYRYVDVTTTTIQSISYSAK